MADVKPEIVTHCRLCAEPTEEELLIATDSIEGLHSQILKKMSFINISIDFSSVLPKAICFSCFDNLERTWKFLVNVQAAQKKLNEIYLKLPPGFEIKPISEIQNSSNVAVEKPVNCDWDEFLKQETEPQLLEKDSKAKSEPESDSGCFEYSKNDFPVKKSKKSRKRKRSHYSEEDDIPILKLKKERKKKKVKKHTEVTKIPKIEVKLECDSYDYDSEIPDANLNLVEASEIITLWYNYTWICGQCDTLCPTIESLRTHSIQVHESCVVFKCFNCAKRIATYKMFIRHVKIHNVLLKNCCDICNLQLPTEDLVKSHRITHNLKNDNSCLNCGVLLEDPEKLKEHILTYAKGLQRHPKSGRRPKNDPVCESDLKCEICSKQFKSKSNLQAHKQVHKERKRDFFCHVCGKNFFTKGTLGTHMLVHEETKQYKCDFCGLGFRAMGNLRSHISLHSGVKPFVCHQCGKSFRVKRHLKSHMIVHTDLMPYTCEYCEKPFRFKTRLNLHLRQHTGAKPYNCTQCQRYFTNGSNFKKHMMRRHNIDTSKKRNVDVIPADKLNSVLTQLKLEIIGTST